MAELVFFSGTMDCGKSTLALQMDHNHRQRGRRGLIFTRLDRAGRLDAVQPARAVHRGRSRSSTTSTSGTSSPTSGCAAAGSTT